MTTSRITLKAARAAHPLAPAVLRQLGNTAEDVATAIDAGNHGADAGWSGFTYYSDTAKFTRRHRAAIAELAKSMADDLGSDGAVSLVRGFNCLDKDTPEQAIALALYGGRVPDSLRQDVQLVENALAWLALEEVGRAIAALAESGQAAQ